MLHFHRGLIVATALAGLCLTVTYADEVAPEGPSTGAAQVIPGKDDELSRITLTEKAAARLNIRTSELRKETDGRLVAPYAAVIYGTTGGTWVYASAEKLTFERKNVVIDTIEGDNAYLRDGPAAGTRVATSGVPELLGIEKGVGEE